MRLSDSLLASMKDVDRGGPRSTAKSNPGE
jgi:hypothetical protein